jgi:hypothetical protein
MIKLKYDPVLFWDDEAGAAKVKELIGEAQKAKDAF